MCFVVCERTGCDVAHTKKLGYRLQPGKSWCIVESTRGDEPLKEQETPTTVWIGG